MSRTTARPAEQAVASGDKSATSSDGGQTAVSTTDEQTAESTEHEQTEVSTEEHQRRSPRNDHATTSTQTATRTMTDTTPSTARNARRTDDTPTRRDGTPMRMRDMDHTPPVEGPNRTFERRNEGKPVRPDGGERTASGDSDAQTDEESDEEEESAGEDGRRQTVGEMDHTPPVSGPNRTFERGNEADEDV